MTQVERITTFTIDGHQLSAPALTSGLYVVATPIGNLADTSLRALQTLAGVDTCWCEDTRRTRQLLAHFSIITPTRSYRPQNAARQIPRIIDALQDGKAVALVSDAGTPLISDPGARLVAAVIAAGHPLVAVPGASAVLTALVGAGLPVDQFYFAGFLPTRGKARRRMLTRVARATVTVVLFEAPHRLHKTLNDLLHHCGADRRAVVAREMTKKFETWERRPLGEMVATIQPDAAIRGEHVIVLEGAGEPTSAERSLAALSMEARISALAARGLPLKTIAAMIASQMDVPRRMVYQRALAMRAEPVTGEKEPDV